MASEAITIQPNKLIELAIQQNANPDVLAKLLVVQERWEANEARKAYVSAMNAFKSNPPTINKNKRVHFTSQKGTTDYKHATLDNVCDVIGSALSKQGLSFRWETEQADGHVKVTCIVTHEMGHSERTYLVADPDNTGNKNSIQAVGSTVTYLQRYTLLAITGMATEDQDTDGVLLTGELKDILEIILNSATANELRAAYAEGIKQAKKSAEKVVLMDAYEKRKKELCA
jgi:hypothetical protein